MKMSSLLMMGLLLTGCGGDSGGGGDAAPVAPEISSESQDITASGTVENTLKVSRSRIVNLKKDFSNATEFKQNINKHKIVFKAETGHYTNAKVVCVKDGFGQQNEEFSGWFNEAGLKAEVILTIADNDPSEVNFKCSVKDWGFALAEQDIQILKSVVIEGNKEIISSIGTAPIGTLYLEKNSVLSFHDKTVQLIAEEVISNSAKVVTFTEDLSASTLKDRDGKSGGTIMLFTQKAVGRLTAELRGLNGGTRTPPPPKTSEGAKGADGQCSHKKYYGDAATRCPGKNGGDGEVGSDGLRGTRGGSTGSIEASIKNSDDLFIEVKYFIGKAGAGSPGGLGGKGGAPGIGSTARVEEYCGDCHGPGGQGGGGGKSMLDRGATRRWPDGNRGPDGGQGVKGPSGNPGRIDMSNVDLGEGKHSIDRDWNNKEIK